MYLFHTCKCSERVEDFSVTARQHGRAALSPRCLASEGRRKVIAVSSPLGIEQGFISTSLLLLTRRPSQGGSKRLSGGHDQQPQEEEGVWGGRADSWLAAMLTASCNGGLIGLSGVETTAVTLTRGGGDRWRRGGRGVDTDR